MRGGGIWFEPKSLALRFFAALIRPAPRTAFAAFAFLCSGAANVGAAIAGHDSRPANPRRAAPDAADASAQLADRASPPVPGCIAQSPRTVTGSGGPITHDPWSITPTPRSITPTPRSPGCAPLHSGAARRRPGATRRKPEATRRDSRASRRDPALPPLRPALTLRRLGARGDGSEARGHGPEGWGRCLGGWGRGRRAVGNQDERGERGGGGVTRRGGRASTPRARRTRMGLSRGCGGGNDTSEEEVNAQRRRTRVLSSSPNVRKPHLELGDPFVGYGCVFELKHG